MTIGELLREALERKYKGRRIKLSRGEGEFVVDHVEVSDGGVDPQWEITISSELCKQMNAEASAWQTANNLLGGVMAPKELEEQWRRGWVESYFFTNCDQVLPEIIKVPEPEEDELDLDSCEQCGEAAWDGYICHSCGMKHI